MKQPIKTALHEVATESASRPKATKPKEPMTRGQRHAALAEKLLGAVELGAEGS